MSGSPANYISRKKPGDAGNRSARCRPTSSTPSPRSYGSRSTAPACPASLSPPTPERPPRSETCRQKSRRSPRGSGRRATFSANSSKSCEKLVIQVVQRVADSADARREGVDVNLDASGVPAAANHLFLPPRGGSSAVPGAGRQTLPCLSNHGSGRKGNQRFPQVGDETVPGVTPAGRNAAPTAGVTRGTETTAAAERGNHEDGR
jgi:hypothetical protein